MNANAEFLNYVYQNSQMGVDTLEQLLDITEDEKLQAYLTESEAMSAEDMKLKLEGVDPTVQQVFTEGIASMQDQLSDAGNPNRYDTYTQEKYQNVVKAMEEVLNEK